MIQRVLSPVSAKAGVGLLSICFVLMLTACTSIGPKTIPRDRFDYNAAMSESWKEQTLLNIVKLRYADVPLFVQIASVVSGYTLESSVSIAGINSTPRDSLVAGGSAKYTDRPTITYVPITGDQFNRTFMTPIDPRIVLFLLQSGWSAEVVFPLTVDSINGLRSELATGASRRVGDEGYYQFLYLLREAQLSGATGMQIKRGDDEDETTVLILRRQAVGSEEGAPSKISDLLGLRQDLDNYVVKYGFLASDDTEIALITRSMLQVITNLARQISVPEQHIASGRTLASLEHTESAKRKLIQVSYAQEKPENAFVAVRYRDYWYYIDDGDFDSKRVFSFVMILLSLVESRDDVGLPIVTIPAG